MSRVCPAAFRSSSSWPIARPGGGVHRAGRLIGQQHRRVVDQRPGDRHPLPLPAGQPPRVGVPVPFDAQLGQQLVGPRPGRAAPHPGQPGRQHHVAGHGQVLHQVEELEDHPDLGAAVPGGPGLPQPVDPLPGHRDRPGRRLVQPGHQVQQRRLAAPRRPHHRHRLPGRHLHADPVQARRPAGGIPLRHLAELDQRIHGRTSCLSGWSCPAAARRQAVARHWGRGPHGDVWPHTRRHAVTRVKQELLTPCYRRQACW